MKPFRGKPEKPESSNEEIQRGSQWVAPFARRLSFAIFATGVCILSAGACTSPPVGRRDLLGVGLRLAVEPVRFGVRTRDVPADCLTVD